jgi:hypothetical protein
MDKKDFRFVVDLLVVLLYIAIPPSDLDWLVNLILFSYIFTRL